MSKAVNLGVDLGNANVKTSKGIIFESRVKTGITNMNESDIKIKLDKINYTIGTTDGSLNISKKRHKKPAYKQCLLTAIAKSFNTKNINCNVVVGVPVEKFNDIELKNEIKETILSWGPQKIIINDTEKKINIENVEVFCESAIVFSDKERFKNEKTLVLDFGGSTVDCSFWDGLRQLESRTLKDGMISLYEKIAKAINDEYGTDMKAHMVVDMIGKDKYMINQEEKDISFVDALVRNHVDGLTSTIQQSFDVDAATTIQLIGGGAIQLYKYIKDEFETADLAENAGFVNADNYEKVGDMIWI